MIDFLASLIHRPWFNLKYVSYYHRLTYSIQCALHLCLEPFDRMLVVAGELLNFERNLDEYVIGEAKTFW